MPPKKPDPHAGEIGWYDADAVWHDGLKPLPPAPVPENPDPFLLLLRAAEQSRLDGIRARVHNGHAEHTDARFLLELLDRYMA